MRTNPGAMRRRRRASGSAQVAPGGEQGPKGGGANAGTETRFLASDRTAGGLAPARVSRTLLAGGWGRGRVRTQDGPFHSQGGHLLVRLPSSSSYPGPRRLRRRRIRAPPRAEGATRSCRRGTTASPRSRVWPWPQAPGPRHLAPPGRAQRGSGHLTPGAPRPRSPRPTAAGSLSGPRPHGRGCVSSTPPAATLPPWGFPGPLKLVKAAERQIRRIRARRCERGSRVSSVAAD